MEKKLISYSKPRPMMMMMMMMMMMTSGLAFWGFKVSPSLSLGEAPEIGGVQ
jgi:hypothetical protein